MRLKNVKCEICKKSETVGFNKPHSLHRTKRVIRPNLQKYMGSLICTRCLKSMDLTQKKSNHVWRQNNSSTESHPVPAA